MLSIDFDWGRKVVQGPCDGVVVDYVCALQLDRLMDIGSGVASCLTWISD